MSSNSKTYGEGNFFSAFWEAKDAIERNPDIYKEHEYSLLIIEIEKYLQSGNWAKDSIDRSLFFYSNKGLTGKIVAEKIGIELPTYRTRMKRVSDRLRSTLFNGSALTDICLGDNVDAVREAIKRINFLNSSIDYYSEFPENIIHLVEERIKKSSHTESFSEEDLFNAIAYLLYNSIRVQKVRLEHINPDALDYVVTKMNTSEFNEIFSYYKSLGNYVFKSQDIPKNIREDIINSYKASEIK